MNSPSVSFVIQGVVRTLTPAIQVSPSTDGNTALMPVASQRYKRSDGREGIAYIPYISANSVRGRIRRAAAHRVFQSLADRGQRIHRYHFLSIARGTYGRDKIGNVGSYQAQMQATRNVFAGLFGGGTMMVKSKYQVGNLIPWIRSVTDSLVPAGLPGDPLPDTEGLRTKLSMTARDDLATIPAFDILEGGEQAWQAHQLEQLSERKLEDSDGQKISAGKNSLKMLDEPYAISADVPLVFTIRANNLTEAQAGLLLMAVSDWCATNEIGGQSARGYGRFSASLSVHEIVDGRISQEAITTITTTGGLGNEQRVTEMINAAKKEIDLIDSELLEQVFPIITEKEQAKRDEKKLKQVQAKAAKGAADKPASTSRA